MALEKSDSRYLFHKEYHSHQKIIGIINQILQAEKPFSIPELNTVFLGKTLSDYISDHENLKTIYQFDFNLYQLALKKVYITDFEKLKKFAREQKKKKRDKLKEQNYSIFDLVQYYRERFNYDGFTYLSSEVMAHQQEVGKFYSASYIVIREFAKSLVDYLESNTNAKLKEKLYEIKSILS